MKEYWIRKAFQLKHQMDAGLTIKRKDLNIVELDMLELLQEETSKLETEERKKMMQKAKTGGSF